MGDEFQKDDDIPGMMFAQCAYETGRKAMGDELQLVANVGEEVSVNR